MRALEPGSSPHTQGTPSFVKPPDYVTLGSSPHTRGTPMERADLEAYYKDHPRIRGEHTAQGVFSRRFHGIIPAYAGNTSTRVRPSSRQPGSSPHTRGTLMQELLKNQQVKGSSPHTRGTPFSPYEAWRFSSGSSPHTRGTHLFTCDPNSRRGSFVSLYPKRRALCLLLASLQPDFLAP